MKHEKILRQFEEIEEKVEKLIERCKGLEADNLKLANKLSNWSGNFRKRLRWKLRRRRLSGQRLKACWPS